MWYFNSGNLCHWYPCTLDWFDNNMKIAEKLKEYWSEQNLSRCLWYEENVG